MIRIRRSIDRGHANHGWLDTYHTFSFANYVDPEHMGFGPLRVLNQDRVAPGQGFGTHGHENMEIISYVLDGRMEHKDNMGNGSEMRPGEVQLMSAGSGVTHSEFNASATDELAFLQMWIIPSERGTTPRYGQQFFPVEQRRGRLCLVASPDGRDGSLVVRQDVCLYAGLLDDAESARHALADGRGAWLHVARGELRLNDEPLGPGDGAAIRDESELLLTGVHDAELVLFDVVLP
ncbi:MAG: pirin family protein [Planctomycetota bacterium]|nr:pirin family protein [Planctomycetota bacterium]